MKDTCPACNGRGVVDDSYGGVQLIGIVGLVTIFSAAAFLIGYFLGG